MDDLEPEILTPQAGLARRAEHPGPQLTPGGVHPHVLLLFADNLLPPATARTAARRLPYTAAQASLHDGTWQDVPVTIAVPGVGAPATALAVEKLVAAGARVLVGVGYGGGLGPGAASGDVVAAVDAVSAEGTSRHYGFTGADPVRVPADAAVTKRLAGGADHAASVATTDAPYRETRPLVRSWREAGAVAVDMETAGLLAVAHHRGARAGGLLVVADRLEEDAWTPAPPGTLDDAARRALTLALDALTAEAP